MAKKEKSEETVEKSSSPARCGLDVGTGNLVAAHLRDKEIDLDTMRNVFLKISDDYRQEIDLKTTTSVEIDGTLYLVGDSAFNTGNVFGLAVRRPMHKGMMSRTDHDAADVVAAMIEKIVGKCPDGGGTCVFSVPAEPMDREQSVLYHTKIFEQILTKLGWTPIPIQEGAAVVYATCRKYHHTGVGFSFGAGMGNASVLFKGGVVKSFSIARGGDWIDESVANCFEGYVPNRVTRLKEDEQFSLGGDLSYEKNKAKRRVLESIQFHYAELIRYAVSSFVGKLGELNIEFPEEVPIVISGGTSKVNGFAEAFETAICSADLPFDISEVILPEDRLTAVAEGCLVRSMKA